MLETRCRVPPVHFGLHFEKARHGPLKGEALLLARHLRRKGRGALPCLSNGGDPAAPRDVPPELLLLRGTLELQAFEVVESRALPFLSLEQCFWAGRRSAQKHAPVVVQLIDESQEASGLVLALAAKLWHLADANGVKILREGAIVRRAEVALAQLSEKCLGHPC